MGYEYLIYSIIGLLATACFGKIFHFATQQGQIFGAYSKWLQSLSERKKWYAKPMGLCEMCFSAWLANISWLIVFAVLHNHWYIWVLHWLCYTSIGTVLNLYFIVSLFTKRAEQQNLNRIKIEPTAVHR